MKKLLSILGTIALGVSSTSLAVSCSSNNFSHNDSDNNQNDTQSQYSLFGKNFLSKEDAISYYLNNEVKIDSKSDYQNDIRFDNKQYDTLSDLYDMVDKTGDIKSKTTHKNPDNYRLDELGMLSDDVVTNEDNQTTVYKNSANQVVDSLDEAQNSYTNKIHTKYEVDGNLFDNETAIISYYKNKYEVEKPDIKQIDNYHLGNSWYSKNGFDKTLDESILKNVYYNNQLINENNKDNYDSFELAKQDKDKVTQLKNRPGMYYIQTKATAKGRLTGNLFQQSQDDLMQSVLDAKNWSLDSTSSESVLDLLLTSVFDGIASIGSISSLNSLANSTDQQAIYDNFDKSISLYLDKLSPDKVEVSTEQFMNILEKYGIKKVAQSYWTGMVPFASLTYTQKITIELYFLRETLRSLDVANDDNKQIKNFYYQILLSLNLVQIDESDNEKQLNNAWMEFVDSYKDDEIMDLLDYLVEPTVLNNDGESKLNMNAKHQEYLENFIKFSEKAMKWLTEVADATLKTIKLALELVESSTIIVEALSVAVAWFGVAIELLDSIEIRTTKIYRFQVSKNQYLTYQQTNWAWEPSDFDPARTFDVLEIAKPVNEVTYLYNDKYFSNLNEAYRYEKRDIMNELFSDEKNIKYTSKYFDGLTYSSKEELIEQVYKIVEVKRAYSDEFGEIFDSYEQALNSILKHIENIDYKKVYVYDFNNIQILRETYKQVYDEILAAINIESKLVDFDELLTTTNFDKLTDLENSGYQIFTFNYTGKNYYFNSQSAATIYYLKLHNFTNELIKIDYSTYTLNNQTFTSREAYIDYLYANLKEITGDNL